MKWYKCEACGQHSCVAREDILAEYGIYDDITGVITNPVCPRYWAMADFRFCFDEDVSDAMRLMESE